MPRGPSQQRYGLYRNSFAEYQARYRGLELVSTAVVCHFGIVYEVAATQTSSYIPDVRHGLVQDERSTQVLFIMALLSTDTTSQD